jgi:hypothetical protein
MALENFCTQNNIQKKYVINQNLNTKTTELHFLPGFLIKKLKEKLD